MPADRADLEKRLAAATPEDTVRGIVFNAGFGVVKRLAGEPEARACDPKQTASRVPFFSYPVTEYLEFAWAAADMLDSLLGGPDRVFHELGAAAMRDVYSSMLGRTLLTLGANDPRQLLSQAPSGYRATVGYGQRSVQWLAPNRAVVSFRRDFLVPEFHCGVLSAALRAIGQKDVVATGRSLRFLDHDVELSWR